MARILDYFRRFLKDILMNNSWSVTPGACPGGGPKGPGPPLEIEKQKKKKKGHQSKY